MFGIVYSLLLAIAAIKFKADQTIVGTAMNMLSVALATVIVKSINLIENPDNPSSTIEYVNAGRKLKFTIAISAKDMILYCALDVRVAI